MAKIDSKTTFVSVNRIKLWNSKGLLSIQKQLLLVLILSAEVTKSLGIEFKNNFC